MSSPPNSTNCVHDAEERPQFENANITPISLAVSYAYPTYEELKRVSLGDKEAVERGADPRHVYSRNTNPTVRTLEKKMAMLEGAEACTSFSTGMAAISNTLYTFLDSGDRVVSIRHTYGGTAQLFLNNLPRRGILPCLVDTEDEDELIRQIRSEPLKMVYLESPTNPTLKILDIERISHVAHEAGALVVVDNTFASPINQNPLQLGADLVIHSATKYLNGHGDAMGGFLCGSAELVNHVFHTREIEGATLQAFDAYLILRGLKTLKLRVEKHNSNAQAVAEFLESHPKVKQVYYPSLPTHPRHEVAKRQMKGYGGMLSFELDGGEEEVARFLNRLKLPALAASLGAIHALISTPCSSSHVECSVEERKSLNISESLVRLSVGIEESADLIADIDQALKD